MAEERNLGVARAVADADGDEDATKAELQRRMEEARESITQTVTEIKETVTNQYQAVRQSVTEALDWREQYRKRPVAWSVGALSVGLIVGYSLGGAFAGDGQDDDDYSSYDDDDLSSAVTSSGIGTAYQGESARSASGRSSLASAAPSYAASSYGTGSAAPAPQQRSSAAAYGSEPETAEEDKPGLLERFKETRAYDRLQEEVSTLGDRFIDELSKVGTTVVLPLLFTKIKDMFGVDLSNKQQRGAGTGTSAAASTGGSSTSGGTQAATGGGTDYRSGSSGGGGASL